MFPVIFKKNSFHSFMKYRKQFSIRLFTKTNKAGLKVYPNFVRINMI